MKSIWTAYRFVVGTYICHSVAARCCSPNHQSVAWRYANDGCPHANVYVSRLVVSESVSCRSFWRQLLLSSAHVSQCCNTMKTNLLLWIYLCLPVIFNSSVGEWLAEWMSLSRRRLQFVVILSLYRRTPYHCIKCGCWELWIPKIPITTATIVLIFTTSIADWLMSRLCSSINSSSSP